MSGHADNESRRLPLLDQCGDCGVINAFAAIGNDAERTRGSRNILTDRDADAPQAEIEGEYGSGS